MAYIGRTPIIGNYQVLDAIVATTTDTYALTKDAVAVFPQTPSNCIVSLNGVIQAPVSSYTISGSNIVFASALTGSDSIDFITVLGDVLNVGTVSDGTIGLAKLSATGTKDATTFLRGDNTFASAGGTNTPAFFVKRSSNQLVVPSTITLVQFNSEDVDTDSCFDSTTNYRFTPTVSGKYFLEAFQYSTFGGTAPANEYVRIRKNGADIAESSSRGASHGYGSLSVATIASANGSTDYFDVTIYGDVGGGGDYYAVGDSPIAKSSFKGFKIIE